MWVMALSPETKLSKLTAMVRSGVDPFNQYLKSFDPDAHGGIGEIETTTNINEAKKFKTVYDVLMEWKRQSTVKPLDYRGQPNLPLTAYSAEPRYLPN